MRVHSTEHSTTGRAILGDDDEDADGVVGLLQSLLLRTTGLAGQTRILHLGQGGTAATGLIGLRSGGDLEDGKYGTHDVIWWGRR